MAYQVLARKWRPQRFEDVIGQQAVTRTLRNAIASGRIAHAFVFAGPRGCGKTTTARILARALSCQQGPTATPCGECDACVEIAQGRDIDVLEIDAASHTGIDNIREVVIAGLSIAPVRNRYKVFIIDEVHQLSAQSFNALLKSIEEPPAHVVFMMATTELHKIPDTILSRSQVFEFRTIPTKAIVAQLRTIAAAEQLDVPDAALSLIARAAEGSMRDAQSALDQVIAFAGTTITVEDVSTVLGLVGRDLLFDLVEAVVAEDAPRAFALADRAVESGHDLRVVCRELSRLLRDLMVVTVDPVRAGDGELDGAERDRITTLAAQFSREDLMRSFDLLSKAEQDIRLASHPRYHFEMVLLRWMHLRRLVPLTDLIEQLGGSAPGGARAALTAASPSRTEPARVTKPAPAHPEDAAATVGKPVAPSHSRTVAPLPLPDPQSPIPDLRIPDPGVNLSSLKDALLAEIRATKAFFYNTVVAQAQKIELVEGRVTFTFLPTHRALREQFDQTRPWLESVAERVAGRKTAVLAVQAAPNPAASTEAGAPAPQMESSPRGNPAPQADSGDDIATRESAPIQSSAVNPKATPTAKRDLKAEALASSTVQAVLDVFPAEIRDVEEM